jgi:hypothetical protein
MLLFDKWLSEATLLQVSFSLPLFTACFRGKVFRFSPDLLVVASDDRTAEVSLRMVSSLEFAYGDSRGTPEAEEFEGTLVIFTGSKDVDGERDFITLAETLP